MSNSKNIRYSDEFKLKVLSDYYSSGMSKFAICKNGGSTIPVFIIGLRFGQLTQKRYLCPLKSYRQTVWVARTEVRQTSRFSRSA